MNSDGPPPDQEVLSGPVDVCVDRPLLSLDRPFTYQAPPELGARVGSVVKVPFHGRATRGWVLGPAAEAPRRMLPIRALVSPVPSFDQQMLGVLRWVAERYVAPLASVIDRAVPPRVAGEESSEVLDAVPPGDRDQLPAPQAGSGTLERYRGGEALLGALAAGGTALFAMRPAPEHEVELAIEVVAHARAQGRTALVLVPEAEPVPATAAAIAEAFGEEVAWFVGGDRRARYRTWLDIRAGRFPIVVGTRPAVFAPLRDLGVVLVSREHHPQHREERAPYYHVREVAAARARLAGAACVLSSYVPTLEAQAMKPIDVAPPGRLWPPVEVVKPGPEGRAPRLVRALRESRHGFVYEPMRGYGVARVCRSCGQPAMCSVCRGSLRAEEGSIRCGVCDADARCAICGGVEFGLARGGVERVAEWVADVAPVPVRRPRDGDVARPPRPDEVVVGGLSSVKDFGTVDADLVAILGADGSLARPGIAARERALAAWFDVAAFARPRGRVILQCSEPADPAVQALVAGNPERFARSEVQRLTEAGFPPGMPVFRVVGDADLPTALAEVHPTTMLVTSHAEATVCLAVIRPERLAAFGSLCRKLASSAGVTRVEAEPHL